MPRRRILAATLATVAAASVLTACSEEPAEKQQTLVDHSTSQTPTQRVDTSGPPAQALRANWRIDVVGAANVKGGTGLDVIAGQVVLVTEKGLIAYDGRTGTERWHYREPGRVMTGYATPGTAPPPGQSKPTPGDDEKESGGGAAGSAGAPGATAGSGAKQQTLVVFTERRGTPPRAIGLDAATGRALWRATPTWRPVINPKNRKAVAGSGVVMGVDQAPEGATVVGIDGTNGQVRWRQRRLQYCDPVNLQGISDTDGSLFVLPEGCFYTVSEVHAFDPATGKQLWRRRPPPDFTNAMVRGGVTMLSSRSERRPFSMLVNSQGKRLRAVPPPCAFGLGCHFTAVGDRVFVSTSEGPKRPELVAVDPRSGKSRTVTLPGGPAEDHVVLSHAGNRLYALRKRLAGPLLPAELDFIDPETLKTQRVAMPFGFQDGGIGEYWEVGRVEGGDGLLYVLGDLGGKVRLTAYAPSGDKGPAALGGTEPKDWPDGCKLISGLDELSRRRVDRFEVDSVRLDDWGCRFTWLSKVKTGVVVIGWVAPDEKQAADMFVVDPAQARLLSDVADQAYTFANVTQGGPDLVMRVGRYIVTSYGIREQEEEDLVNLARTIVRNLQEQTR